MLLVFRVFLWIAGVSIFGALSFSVLSNYLEGRRFLEFCTKLRVGDSITEVVARAESADIRVMDVDGVLSGPPTGALGTATASAAAAWRSAAAARGAPVGSNKPRVLFVHHGLLFFDRQFCETEVLGNEVSNIKRFALD